MMKGTKKLLTYRCCIGIATATVAIAGLLQGCVPFSNWGYGPDSQSREEFERRVETAFRLQNRMTSEVMEIQSEGFDTQNHMPIIQAEQLMEKNCSYLNEYASRDIDGLSKSFLLLRHVENSVVDCEEAAQKVEALLKMHQR
jgi:hypothetical protein